MDPVRFLIYSAGYNCAPWVADCLRSVAAQTTPNYRHVVVDDASTDDTWARIQQAAHPRLTARRNTERMRWTGAALRHLRPEDDEVVVILDLDDQLAGRRVLQTLEAVYQQRQCWLTYGNYCLRDPWQPPFLPRPLHPLWRLIRPPRGQCRQLPERILQQRAFREIPFTTSHLRSFKGFLWNALRPDDLRDWTGQFPPMAGDVACTLPMLEMCAPGRIAFIPRVLYVYNDQNPLNEHRQDRDLQLRLEHWYRLKPRYDILNRS